MAQKNIETGVDKLLELINRRKKIVLEEAAKQLSVSLDIVKEWADFLEDEGLISVEAKLSRTYLCERVLNKTEVEKKVHEYTSKKDAFTRKVEVALSSLQKESEGLDKIKVEFEKLKDSIGRDIDEVRNELQELKHYEELKKNIDKEIFQQKIDYQDMIENFKKKISEEKKNYDSFLDGIANEKSRIDEAVVELSYLEKKEDTLQKRIEALKEILKSVENAVGEQKKIISDAVASAQSKAKDSAKLQKDMRYHIEKEMKPLLSSVKSSENKIISVLNTVLTKVIEKKKSIEKYKLESMEAADKLKEFFEKKSKTENLINSLEKEKKELEKSFQELIAKAKSFNLYMKSNDVKNYIKDLESGLESVEKKKSSFITKILELTELISKK